MAQPNQYYGPYSTDSTGFRVLIHDQNDWADVENHGMDISPGILAAIPIKRHKVLIIIIIIIIIIIQFLKTHYT